VTVKRVETTKTADTLLNQLVEKYGALMFHQSGGCCDGSSPMCYPIGDFKVGQRDVFLGYVGDTNIPFYIGGDQFEYWKHTALVIDVVPGRGSGFSVEAPEGVRFLTVSRVFSDDEVAELEHQGPVLTGPQPGL
jgi:uncharacterized protein (DUF779 family)